MKQQIILSLLFILNLSYTFAQTSLNIGEIAFTGVNHDGADEFSFVLLKNITTGTTITFTDNGWFSTGGFRSNETTITWTSGDNLTCGTQVIITGLSSTNNGGFNNGTVTGSSLALSSSGDQIFAYQGSAPTSGNESSFITAYQGNGPWDFDAASSTTSAKPSVFTDGTNSISFTTERDNVAFTNCGAGTGDASVIYNTLNWTLDASNNTPFNLPVCSNFPCSTPCTAPDIPTVTYSPASTCSDSTITLNISGNLNDATEWFIYSGSCGGTLEGATTTSSFQLAPNSSTTYYIRGEGGCVTPGSCGSVLVTVTPTDDPSFSYASNQYCQNATDPTPTITGLIGGSFTAAPSGLALNTTSGNIDVSASTPNIYAITYTTNGNCPDSHIEYITISGPTIGYDIVSSCNSYTWIDGNTYTSSNFSATHLLTNSLGCDSIATLNLTIFNSNNVTDVQTACDSYTWIDGNTYTSSNNTATHTLTNQHGCDSVITLNLTINNSNTGIDTQIACNTFTWIDGNTYTTSNNTATHTLTNQNSCDSIVTLNLTITTELTATDTQTACDSYTWIDGITYTSSNNSAVDTIPSVQGCDSIITLNLTILNSSTGIDTQTSCNSYTWIDGNTYTSSNNSATHTLTNSVGCDSIVTLNLTINQPNTGIDTQTACNSFTWIDGNTYTSSNNTATHTLTNSNGCDSIVTLNLTIVTTLTSTDMQTACGSYMWIDGITYTSSNNSATHTLTSSQGCDSIVTLDLTILNPTSSTDTQIACDSYTWIDGNTYTSNNNAATHTLTNSVGCDSIVTLDLTILNNTTGIDTQFACGSYTWIDGNVYTTNNNTATHTLTNSVGCDSLVTLDLTIGSPNTGIDTQYSCSDFTWIDGNTYSTSNNTATYTLTNMEGCDSIITLNLTISSSTSSSESITICGGETYTIGANTYNTSGTYSTILVSVNGCDSVVTTNLTVEQEIDTYVERQNAVFTINNTSGATYQWLDCNNNYSPISGETTTTFTASETGSYAVAVTLGNCTDTSICNELPYIIGIENNYLDKVIVYPNPMKDNLTIDIGNDSQNIAISITDISGKIVYNETIYKSKLNLSTDLFNKGIYLLKIQDDDHFKIVKLIKE